MECKICGTQREDLTQHIRKHGISVADYKKKFNERYIVDESKRQKRGSSRKRNFLVRCKLCNRGFETEAALETHYLKTVDTAHSRIVFNESNSDDWVECKICGLRRSRIDIHIKKDHKQITIADYKEKFGNYLSNNFMKRATAGGKVDHESWQYKGENNPFYGKHHTKSARKRISQTAKDNNAKLDTHFNIGKVRTAAFKKNQSKNVAGVNNPMFGKPAAKGTSRGIQGTRKDIGHHVRSTLEANYARYLKYNKIDYEYESKGIQIVDDCGNPTLCWIDFYLPKTDEWIELKNYVGRNIRKFELVQEQHPQLKFRILYQSSQEWKSIETKYSKLIPLWERYNRNFKTHPKLYT